MPQIDAAELRVGLGGALQRRETQAPEDDSHYREQQLLETEHEHGRDDRGDQEEFALRPHQQNRAHKRGVNRYRARSVVHSTAPVRPRAVRKLVPSTRNAIAITSSSARRTKRPSSSPKTSAAPAAKSATTETVVATGPVRSF